MTDKKVYIIHENDDWTKHLIERLDQLSIPYDTWFLDTGLVDIQDTPPAGVFYNRISASSHTRDHRYAPELTSQVLPWLESHQASVVNGSRAIELEVSKIKQYLALQNQVSKRLKRLLQLVKKKLSKQLKNSILSHLLLNTTGQVKGLG